MKYYSTNNRNFEASFQDVLLQGQAPDRGLYLPEIIPKINSNSLATYHQKSYAQIAYEISSLYIEDEIPSGELKAIIEDAYNFKVPIDLVLPNKYILRLDQGPTAAFKDFAARMMSRMMQYYTKKNDQKIVILVATSGDTGGAIADAFHNLDYIDIIILYPPEISVRQRKQMTTLGGNITTLEIGGNFDNCQALVKEAFADSDLHNIPLNSANSINWGRILPQIIYYFYAYSRIVPNADKQVLFSVPSGNFGDLFGGLLASKMGLPVKKFIAAVNENDEFPKFLRSGVYKKVEPSRNCLSSAMNVGHPSNLARIIDIYGGNLDHNGILNKRPDMEKIRDDIWSISISDEETLKTIKDVYSNHNYILEPHGAVGWQGLIKYCLTEYENPIPKNPVIIFETANPAKFPIKMQEALGFSPPMTSKMKKQQYINEKRNKFPKDYQAFKSFLLEKYPY